MDGKKNEKRMKKRHSTNFMGNGRAQAKAAANLFAGSTIYATRDS